MRAICAPSATQCGRAALRAWQTPRMSEFAAVDALTDLHYLWGSDAPTSLIDCPGLAQRAGVARVLIKAEWQRPFGNFKSLGGMFAGLRTLARHCGATSLVALLRDMPSTRSLPRLICASDGNHGLAIAAAAQRAATGCSIYLPHGVEHARIARIKAQGAMVVSVCGTYDDAVVAAENAALRGEGLLVPDTSADPRSVAVRDVMTGYSRITTELVGQFRALGELPTHVLVQAGVGGLAAAVVRGLKPHVHEFCQWIAVEPANAACVGLALALGHPQRVDGTLETSARMLSCGLVSAAALEILQAAGASAMAVDEAELESAVAELHALTGIDTTPSGAAGVAGLLRISACEARRGAHGLGMQSVVLLLVTEGRTPLP